MTSAPPDSTLPDVASLYREIAGIEPDTVTITRIRRIGRLLKLTETDSGWILLVVLAAHAASAATNLQAASTLAASLGVAAGNVTRTGEALREATETAASTIALAIDQAKPALSNVFEAAEIQARWSIAGIEDNLSRTIEATGSKTGSSIATQIETAVRQATAAFNGDTRQIIAHIENAIAAAIASASRTLEASATDLREGATAARDATVEEWRSRAVTAISKAMEERVRIDATEARLSALKIGGTIVVAVLIMIAVIFYGSHRAIWQDGYATGATAAALHHDQQTIRASWANTHDGKLAYQLYLAGAIPILATCNRPGWEIRKGGTVCYPYAKGKTIYGWGIHP